MIAAYLQGFKSYTCTSTIPVNTLAAPHGARAATFRTPADIWPAAADTRGPSPEDAAGIHRTAARERSEAEAERIHRPAEAAENTRRPAEERIRRPAEEAEEHIRRPAEERIRRLPEEHIRLLAAAEILLWGPLGILRPSVRHMRWPVQLDKKLAAGSLAWYWVQTAVRLLRLPAGLAHAQERERPKPACVPAWIRCEKHRFLSISISPRFQRYKYAI